MFFMMLVIGLSLSQWMYGQSNTSSLSGTVVDGTGAVIPGVSISLANTASGSAQEGHTNSSGEFSFEQLAPGSYEVTAKAPDFTEQLQKVELLISTPLKLHFRLTAGTSEIVLVEATVAALDTTDATLGKAFNSQQIQNLPYLANNVTYLLSLQPGVLALDSGAQTGGLNQDTRTGIVNGARQDQTNLTLDGVDNNDQIFGYAFNGALRSTRESVEEFRVTTTNANADAGRSSGAQVSLVTRSGTNAYHGSAYEFYRDPATTSNNWFNKQAQLNSGLPNVAAKVLEHTYGASLGLPIKKDKLFFFGAYEGFTQASNILVSQTVPSTLGGGGLVTGNVTYQVCPTSAGCKSSTTTKTLTPTDIAQLDGRVNDSACLTTACAAPSTSAAAIAYFKTFPLANSNATGDGYNTGTYNFTSPAPIHQITNTARLDYNFSAKQSFFVRGNLQSDNESTALQFPGLPAAATIFGNNKGMVAGWIWNVSDHATNNFRYGFTRLGNASRGTGSQPFVSFGAFTNINATTSTSVYGVDTNDFEDEYTLIKGRHTIQAGASIYLISNGQHFDGTLQNYANVDPNLLSTAAIANQGTGGSFDPAAFNCADCGTVSSGFQNFYNAAIIANAGVIERARSGTAFKIVGNTMVPQPAGYVPTFTYRNLEQEYFVQDQWKATSRLTLTVGLRYVYLGVPYETSGQQIAPSISLNQFLNDRIAGAASGNAYTDPISFRTAGSKNGQPNFWTPQKLNFAPRFAFAYATADNKSSVRGGFALSFDHFGQAIIDNYQSSNSALFSVVPTNQTYFDADINTNPRFTGYHDVPSSGGYTDTLQLPYTPADQAFSFDNSINDKQNTPYAETFNLTLEHQFPHSLDVTASYVGRLGRHLLQSRDAAQPTNYVDPGSGQSYFQAATAYRKLLDAGVSPANIPNTGYFQNLFPNFSVLNGSGGTYTGAQAYYASLGANIGNETNTLFQADTDPTASAAGQAFRFFYPQTSSIYTQTTVGTSNYNALQLSVRQALKYGLIYDVNYTYAKSMDEGSDPERVANGSPIINTFNQSQMYAVSDFDVRHNITANYTAPFPFGRGTPFLNRGGLMDRIVGGFQLNGVVHYSTGFPFSAVAANTYGTNFAFSSFMVETAPIHTGGHHYDPATQTETALKGMTSAQAAANLRFAYPGETGQRNNLRADGYFSLDDGLAKSIHTFEGQELRLSAEVFNVLNTNRFNSLGATLTNGSSQNPLQTDGTNTTNFGAYIGGQNALLTQPRQMQFSAKYSF